MAWKRVTTRTDHTCWICQQVIPVGTSCLSESKLDTSGTWQTRHMCPSGSCYFPAAERQKLLAKPKPIQETLAL